jgi:alcohol dehydrogenase
MKAVFFEQFGGPLRVETLPDPAPPKDGVVIEVKANGICRSDWHGWQGHDSDVHLPHVPGHELAGIIVATGPETRRWKMGDPVTVPFAVGCGYCIQCRAGHSHICDDYFQPGFTAWGSFAQYVAIPHADFNLVRLPEDLDFVESASLGCRFTTAFRAVITQGRLSPGEWLAVHGCGGIGLAAVMIAHAMGAQVVAVDIKDESLKMAAEMGAQHILNTHTNSRVVDVVREITRGGAHVSIDALGSKETCHNSIACLRKQGRHVQVGLMTGDDREALVPMPLVIARELEVLGSHGMPTPDFQQLFGLIQTGRLQPARLIRKRVTLAESVEELAAMGAFRQVGIVVIDRFT